MLDDAVVGQLKLRTVKVGDAAAAAKIRLRRNRRVQSIDQENTFTSTKKLAKLISQRASMIRSHVLGWLRPMEACSVGGIHSNTARLPLLCFLMKRQFLWRR